MRVLPEAVCWHEGMQLLPQHFQLQGLRAEVLAALCTEASNPWFWGVIDWDFDPKALSDGRVRITELKAIMPDGLPVNLQSGNGATLELDIGPSIAAATTPSVTVYLAINPLVRSGQVQPLDGRLQSYDSDAIPDLASGEYPERIKVWRPNLRLVTERERADSICLPLLRIAKEGGKFIKKPYVPPMPLVLPGSEIGKAITEVCARGREKCLFLSERLRLAEQAGNRDDISALRQQLTALWARLPEVEASLNSRVATPGRLHGLLVGLAGSWCALDLLRGVPAFSPLDFFDLKLGFDEVIQWLNLRLDCVRVGYRYLEFEPDSHGFSIALPDVVARQQRLVVGLRMPAGSGEQAAQSWLAQAVIASRHFISTLAQQRMSGLLYEPMSRHERAAYGVGDDTHLFLINASGEWFDAEQPLSLSTLMRTDAVSPWQVLLFIPDTD